MNYKIKIPHSIFQCALRYNVLTDYPECYWTVKEMPNENDLLLKILDFGLDNKVPLDFIQENALAVVVEQAFLKNKKIGEDLKIYEIRFDRL